MSSARPAGTVTFLFTDIEGSTKLWERHPLQMKQALARHDALLRSIFESRQGYVFKTVGDAFCVAFTSPSDALQAALEAQRALFLETWGETPIRVRMGLHCGEAEERDGDYFGPPLNRAARLMSAGHGGQILLSRATEELVRNQLPEGAKLHDMGRRNLKDLSQPEHIFQIDVPDLPSEFPALRTLDIKLYNLPSQLTPFIGRESELEEIRHLISPRDTANRNVRLLTLTGPGGTGKTRLALQVAANCLDDFEDGVLFVDLAAVRDPALVFPAIERSLGLREKHGQPSHETLSEHLRGKQLLLVLDNFEQVLPAADDIAGLLSTAPGLTILVTSRTILRVYGEVYFEVPSLKVPDLRRLPPLEQLAKYESIQLFIEQARAVKSGFTLSGNIAAVIAEICNRLDGLPLAIELAAARIRLLTPQQILAQLENRLRFLSGGARNLPARQQTLQGAIDWSYDLLDPQDQILFRRLSIFAGGCTYEAAEAICNFSDNIDILRGLESLIDHSLVGQSETDAEPRFIMLQTIHDYAVKKLESSGELDELRRQHLDFYAQLAEEAQQFLELAEQNLWLDRLERDYDNFSAAIRCAIDLQDAQQGVRLAQALRLFWFSRGYLSEGRRLMSELLSLPMESSSRAVLLDCAGFLARYHGDFATAELHISEGLAISRQIGDQHAIADSLANAGFVYLQQDLLDQAREVYTEALAIYHENSNEQGMADATIHLGLIAFFENKHAMAQQYFEESLTIWQRLGDSQGITYAQHMLGDAAFQQGNYETAENLYRSSLRGAVEIRFQLVIAASFEGLACISIIQQNPQRALQLAGAAAELRMIANVPASEARVRFIDQALASARQTLGDDQANSARNEGAALTLGEAVSYAQDRP